MSQRSAAIVGGQHTRPVTASACQVNSTHERGVGTASSATVTDAAPSRVLQTCGGTTRVSAASAVAQTTSTSAMPSVLRCHGAPIRSAYRRPSLASMRNVVLNACAANRTRATSTSWCAIASGTSRRSLRTRPVGVRSPNAR